MIDLGTPARGLAFVRHVETVDHYPGSAIYLTQQSQEKIAEQQFDVVAVGEWERCEDEDCDRVHRYPHLWPSCWGLHGHDVEVGDWVLCRKRSWSATPDPHVFVVRCDDILGKFVVTTPEIASAADRALQRIDEQKDEDVEAWARQLAEDVADATD